MCTDAKPSTIPDLPVVVLQVRQEKPRKWLLINYHDADEQCRPHQSKLRGLYGIEFPYTTRISRQPQRKMRVTDHADIVVEFRRTKLSTSYDSTNADWVTKALKNFASIVDSPS